MAGFDWPIFASQHPAIALGLAQLSRGECFEAHETLEAVWIEATGQEKRLLQGLIQLAVAWHHWQQGNFTGAKGVLGRARHNLSTCAAEAQLPLEDPATLLAELARLADRLEAAQAAPAPPLIQLRRKP